MSTALAPPLLRTQYEHMGEREDAVRRAAALHGGSLRRLAQEAGLSTRLLSMVVSGDRTATVRTIEKLTEAMARLAERHTEALRVLQESITQEREEDDT